MDNLGRRRGREFALGTKGTLRAPGRAKTGCSGKVRVEVRCVGIVAG